MVNAKIRVRGLVGMAYARINVFHMRSVITIQQLYIGVCVCVNNKCMFIDDTHLCAPISNSKFVNCGLFFISACGNNPLFP